MNLPRVTTQEEWLAARKALRAKEESLAQALEAVTAERRRLPMVETTQEYAFSGPDGEVDLLDLFTGRSQLIVYHFWFEPGEEPCNGCSLWVSNLCPLANLHAADTSLAMVSRATSAEIETVKEQRGWTMPWFSAVGDGFNADVGYDGVAQLTIFVRRDETVFHTYAVSGSALEEISNHWNLLDLTPRGR